MFERLTWLRRLQLVVAVATILFVLVLGALALRTALGDDAELGASVRPVMPSSTTLVASASTAAGTSAPETSSRLRQATASAAGASSGGR